VTFSTGTTIRVIGKAEVDAKLLAAAPRILAQNRGMVNTMLTAVRDEITPGTPVGPGHFGVHLKDSYKVEIHSEGVKTTGKLKAAVQGYWREFGTKGRYRGRTKALRALARTVGSGLGGEKAGLYATHAMNGMRKFLRFYYGKAQWWRL